MKIARKIIASLLISSITLIGMMGSAYAKLITTDQIAVTESVSSARAKLAAEIVRPDVVSRLEAMGISESDAQQRVAALSDSEAQSLAIGMDKMPAGGEVIGVLFGVFVILLVTDILGFTKIFPFTRSVR
jgi:hypothetical protein